MNWNPLGRKAMAKKAENVRDALIKGVSPHKMAQLVVERCQREHPEKWGRAAIAQLAEILRIDRDEARMWVSEHCQVLTKV
jgi:hypothetical protein